MSIVCVKCACRPCDIAGLACVGCEAKRLRAEVERLTREIETLLPRDKPAECAEGCPPNQVCDWCSGHKEVFRNSAFEAWRKKCAEVEAARNWRMAAYAALGVARDRMTPSDVEAVQRFLGPLDDALRGGEAT